MTDKPMTAAGRALWEICSQPRDGLGWVATHILAIEAEAVADYLASDAFTEALAAALGDRFDIADYRGNPTGVIFADSRDAAKAIAAAMRGEQE